MHSIFALIIMAVLMIWNPSAAIAEGIMIDDFKSQPETRWRFIADTVMGGGLQRKGLVLPRRRTISRTDGRERKYEK